MVQRFGIIRKTLSMHSVKIIIIKDRLKVYRVEKVRRLSRTSRRAELTGCIYGKPVKTSNKNIFTEAEVKQLSDT
jgi:hypothetical protein